MATGPGSTRPAARGRSHWLTFLAAGLIVGAIVVVIILMVNGQGGRPGGRDLSVDITLPQPVLPDTPALPEGPILPPVEPHVASGPATESVP
ncbi:MAG: hypothetical protein ACOH1H_01750 [Brevundimonas sp.]|jgi:hypothetical protein